MAVVLFLFTALVAAADGLSQDGLIGGTVVNSSCDQRPVAGAKVVLEMESNGSVALLDETTTDRSGRFLFRNLLVSQHIQYKPSAQFAGIHYPGPQVHLVDARNTAAVTLAVRDVVRAPNPLLVRRHDISVRSATGVLEVTESLTVENPLRETYVGPAAASHDMAPTTLQLSIPSDFQKVTFHSASLGRSFVVRDGTLVTSIPWEPGRRELKFTYFLHNTSAQRVWERTLDLPTETLQVRVATTAPDQVTCNLDRAAETRRAGYTEVVFTSGSRALPAQHVVQLALDALPVPWMTYGKWCAALVLCALIAWGRLVRYRQRATHGPACTDAQLSVVSTHPAARAARRQRRRPGRNSRRAA